ncbi:MAG: hypothetical protein M3512_16855, partial [Bacteroidota bacterium]|nr:hypothetical protein [Bacteroidota bacterium]
MKSFDHKSAKRILCFFFILIFHLNNLPEIYAQYSGIDDDIANHRKGELTINAKPGEQVEVEQLSHEFWFG